MILLDLGQPLCPCMGIETHGHCAIGPDHHRAFDHTGLLAHQGLGRRGVDDLRLGIGTQCAPGRASAVDQGFPTHVFDPTRKAVGGYTRLLEVVKHHLDGLGSQPGPGLFHRVAVRDSIQGHHAAIIGCLYRVCCHCHNAGSLTLGIVDMTDWPTTLTQWLAHCESIHCKPIDMGLDRVRRVAQRMHGGAGLVPGCPVITVAGTNGKGSTCAMLETIYTQAGFRTAQYTSPHLVHFEERARWLAAPLPAEALLPSFVAVERARRGEAEGDEVSLTYFEFTTLALVDALSRQGPDVMILEVGMGGRLDAVNVFDPDCAVITSIDLDHMQFLGPDREAIGREKAGIMRAGRPVVVSDPVPPQSVIDQAQALGADLWRLGRDHHFAGDKQQWGWTGRSRRYSGLAYPALRGANQLLNASGVLAVLEAMQPRLPVTAQAVRAGLALVELPGRFQIVPGQPTLVLDVAHNPHSVAALAENLDAMGFYPRTHAVFGAMADKDLLPMFARIAPLVDRWYFCDLPTPRAAKAADLSARHAQWAGPSHTGVSSQHPDPSAALQAAVAAADPADRIVVFGSFYTVGGVLQHGVPRLSAKHLQA